jgi:hypothetical protein
MEYIVKKILSYASSTPIRKALGTESFAVRLKVFPATEDDALAKQWARSVTDIDGEVLCGAP